MNPNKPTPDLEPLLSALAGLPLDFDQLARQLTRDPRLVAELSALWDLEVDRTPAASVFRPASVDYGG